MNRVEGRQGNDRSGRNEYKHAAEVNSIECNLWMQDVLTGAKKAQLQQERKDRVYSNGTDSSISPDSF